MKNTMKKKKEKSKRTNHFEKKKEKLAKEQYIKDLKTQSWIVGADFWKLSFSFFYQAR